jgi:peptidoglycan/LPS O-acetylase OafA/YrhL
MFFVISGFVIASSTMREVASTNTFSWSAFLHRRVRRLLPGMAVVAVTTSVFAMLFLSPFGPQKETAKMLLSAASYTTNFVLMPQSYFSLDPKANPLMHLWSLAVEEQMYFVWPIAVVLFVGLRKRLSAVVFKPLIWAAVVGVVLASCWLFIECSVNGSTVNDAWWFKPFIQRGITPEHFAFYSPFTRAWEFMAGVLVALILRLKIVIAMQKVGSVVTCCGAGLVLLGVTWASKSPTIQHEGSWSTNTSATLTVVVGTALWILGGSNDKLFHRVLSTRPLTLIGDCSYSIYLLHWPIWVLLITSFDQSWKTVVAAFGLSLGLGWLQFQLIEEPIRLRKRFPVARTFQFVGIFGLVAVLEFGAMSATTPAIALHLTGKQPDEITLHVIEQPCPGERFELETAQTCIFQSSSNQGIAILVGDSMAKSLSDGFVQASQAQGLSSYVFAYPGCAFLASDSPFTATNECASWRANVLSALQQLQPDALAIANLNSLYVETPFPEWTLANTELAWGSELARTLEGLAELQVPIILVQPPPLFSYDLRYDVSLIKRNSVKESRGEVVGRREKMNTIEENAISGIGSVWQTLNFTDQFCNENECDPKKDGKFMFEDSDHLSIDGSQLLVPQLQAAISGALGL